MTRPPQTEEDERANLAVELGWLTGRAMQITGTLPRVIAERIERGGLNLNPMSVLELADLCRDIRAELPVLNGMPKPGLFDIELP